MMAFGNKQILNIGKYENISVNRIYLKKLRSLSGMEDKFQDFSEF